MDSKLLSALRTKSEADELLIELELLKRSLYENGESSFRSTLDNRVRYWVAEIISEEIRGKDTEDYINSLMKKIKNMEEFKLTLAFVPSNTGLNRMLEFVRENVAENIVLDIDHDPTILGGTIISYKGKYHDFSLIKIFDTEFEHKREMFIKLLEKHNNIDTESDKK